MMGRTTIIPISTGMEQREYLDILDGGWDARLQVEGIIHRKYFKTYEEALAQRRAWEQELNPSGLGVRNADD